MTDGPCSTSEDQILEGISHTWFSYPEHRYVLCLLNQKHSNDKQNIQIGFGARSPSTEMLQMEMPSLVIHIM